MLTSTFLPMKMMQLLAGLREVNNMADIIYLLKDGVFFLVLIVCSLEKNMGKYGK